MPHRPHRMFANAIVTVAVMAAALFPAVRSDAVTVFQMDTFDTGSQGWTGGSLSGQVPDGGPGGAGDGFLRVISQGGNGNGSRFIVFNNNQWAGDYLGTEVNAITFDAINLGNTPLHLRIAFGDNAAPLNGGNWFASTVSQIVNPGSGWVPLTFPVDDNDYQRVEGNGDFEDVLSGVFSMRILSAVSASAFGDIAVADGGFDNIRAIPEPTVLLLGGLGLVFVLWRRDR